MATLNVTLDSEGFEANLNGMIATADKAATHVESRFRKVSVSLQQQVKNLNKNIDLNFIINKNGVSPIAKLQKELESLARSATEVAEKLSSTIIRFNPGSLNNTAETILGGSSEQIASKVKANINTAVQKVSNSPAKKVKTKIENEVIVKEKVIYNPAKPIIHKNNQSQTRIVTGPNGSESYRQILGALESERSAQLVEHALAKDDAKRKEIKTLIKKSADEKAKSLVDLFKSLNIDARIQGQTLLNMSKSKVEIPFEELLKTASESKSNQAIEKYIQQTIQSRQKVAQNAKEKVKSANAAVAASYSFDEGLKVYQAKKQQIHNEPDEAIKTTLIKELTRSANALHGEFSKNLKSIKIDGKPIAGIISIGLFKEMLKSDANISIQGIIDNAKKNNSGLAMQEYIRSMVPEKSKDYSKKIKVKEKDPFYYVNDLNRQLRATDRSIDALEANVLKERIVNPDAKYNEAAHNRVVNAYQKNFETGKAVLANQMHMLGMIGNSTDLTDKMLNSMIRSNVKFSKEDFKGVTKDTDLSAHIAGLITKKQAEAQLAATEAAKKPIVVKQEVEIKPKIKESKTSQDPDLLAVQRGITGLQKKYGMFVKQGLTYSKDAIKVDKLSGLLSEEGLGTKRYELFNTKKTEIDTAVEKTRKTVNDYIKSRGVTGEISETIFREMVKKNVKVPISAMLENTKDQTLNQYLESVIKNNQKVIKKEVDKQLTTEKPAGISSIASLHEDMIKQKQREIDTRRTALGAGKGLSGDISEEGLGKELYKKLEETGGPLRGRIEETRKHIQKVISEYGIEDEINKEIFNKIIGKNISSRPSDIIKGAKSIGLNKYLEGLVEDKKPISIKTPATDKLKQASLRLGPTQGITTDEAIEKYIQNNEKGAAKLFRKSMQTFREYKEDYEESIHELMFKARRLGFSGKSTSLKDLGPDVKLEMDVADELHNARRKDLHRIVKKTLSSSGVTGTLLAETFDDMIDSGEKITLSDFKSKGKAENMHEFVTNTIADKRKKTLENSIPLTDELTQNSYDIFKRETDKIETLKRNFEKVKNRMIFEAGGDETKILDNKQKSLGVFEKFVHDRIDEYANTVNTILGRAHMGGFIQKATMREMFSSDKRLDLDEFVSTNTPTGFKGYNPLSQESSEEYFRKEIAKKIMPDKKPQRITNIQQPTIDVKTESFASKNRSFSSIIASYQDDVRKLSLLPTVTDDDKKLYESTKQKVEEYKKSATSYLKRFIKNAGIEGMVEDETINAILGSSKNISLDKIAKNNLGVNKLDEHINNLLKGITVESKGKPADKIGVTSPSLKIAEDQVKQYNELVTKLKMAEGQFITAQKRMARGSGTGALTEKSLGAEPFARYTKLKEGIEAEKARGLAALNDLIKQSGIEGVVSREVLDAMLRGNKPVSLRQIASHNPNTSNLNDHIKKEIEANKKVVTPEMFQRYQGDFDKNLKVAFEIQDKIDSISNEIKKSNNRKTKKISSEVIKSMEEDKKSLREQIKVFKEKSNEILAKAWNLDENPQNRGVVGRFSNKLFSSVVGNRESFGLEDQLTTFNRFQGSFPQYIRHLIAESKVNKVNRKEVIESTTVQEKEYASILKEAQAEYKKYRKVSDKLLSGILTPEEKNDELLKKGTFAKSLDIKRRQLNKIAEISGHGDKAIAQSFFESILLSKFSLQQHQMAPAGYDLFKQFADIGAPKSELDSIKPLYNRQQSGTFGNTDKKVNVDTITADAEKVIKAKNKLVTATGPQKAYERGLVFDIFGLSILHQLPWDSVTNKIKDFTSVIASHFKTRQTMQVPIQAQTDAMIQDFKNIPLKALESQGKPRIAEITRDINVSASLVDTAYHRPMSDPTRIDKEKYRTYQNVFLLADQYVDKLHEIDEIKLRPFTDNIEDYKKRHTQLSTIKSELEQIQKDMLAQKYNGVSISENVFGDKNQELRIKGFFDPITKKNIPGAIDEITAHMKSLELATGMAGKEFEYLTFKRASWTATDAEKERLNVISNSMSEKDKKKRREELFANPEISQASNANREIARLNKIAEIEQHITNLRKLRNEAERASGGPNGALYNKLTQAIEKGGGIIEKMNGMSKSNPVNFGNQIDNANIYLRKVKEIYATQDAAITSIHKKQVQHQSQLAQWFETFGMTMSGVAATVFVGQYVFMAFKALSDLKTVLEDKVEALGPLRNSGMGQSFGTEQQEGIEKIIRTVSEQSSMTIDQTTANLKYAMQHGKDLNEAVKTLVGSRMQKESDTIANTIHALTNMFQEIALSVFDRFSETAKEKLKELTDYLRKNKEGIADVIYGFARGMGVIVSSIAPALKILELMLLTLAKIADTWPRLTSAALFFIATMVVSSKIPFFATMELSLAKLVSAFSVAGIAAGVSFTKGLMIGFMKKSLITLVIGGIIWGISKIAEPYIEKMLKPKDSTEDIKEQLDKKRNEVIKFEKELDEKISQRDYSNGNPYNSYALDKVIVNLKTKIKTAKDEIANLQEQTTPADAKGIMVGLVDGDTVIALVNNEFKRIRLAYINAEESVSKVKENTQKGKVTSLFTGMIFSPGDKMTLSDYLDENNLEKLDHYGRTIAKITKEGMDNVSHQKLLIQAGLAPYKEYTAEGGKVAVDDELKNVKVLPGAVKKYNDVIEHEMNDTAKLIGLRLDESTQDLGTSIAFMTPYVKEFRDTVLLLAEAEKEMPMELKFPEYFDSSKFSKGKLQEIDGYITKYVQLQSVINETAEEEKNIAAFITATGAAKEAGWAERAIRQFEEFNKGRRAQAKTRDSQKLLNEEGAKFANEYKSYMRGIDKELFDGHQKRMNMFNEESKLRLAVAEKEFQRVSETQKKLYAIQLRVGNQSGAEETRNALLKESDRLAGQKEQITSTSYTQEVESAKNELIQNLRREKSQMIATNYMDLLKSIVKMQESYSEDEMKNFKKLAEIGKLDPLQVESIESLFKNYKAQLSLAKVRQQTGSQDIKIEKEQYKEGLSDIEIADRVKKYEKSENAIEKQLENIDSLLYGKNSTREESILKSLENIKNINLGKKPEEIKRFLLALGKTQEELDEMYKKAASKAPLLGLKQEFDNDLISMKLITEDTSLTFAEHIDVIDELIKKYRALAESTKDPLAKMMLLNLVAPIETDRGRISESGHKEGLSAVKDLMSELKQGGTDTMVELNNLTKQLGKSAADFEIELINIEYEEKYRHLMAYAKERILEEGKTSKVIADIQAMADALEIARQRKAKLQNQEDQLQNTGNPWEGVKNGMFISFDRMTERMETFATASKQTFDTLTSGISQAFGDNVASILDGKFDDILTSWESLMKNMLSQFTATMIKIAIQNAALNMFGDAMGKTTSKSTQLSSNMSESVFAKVFGTAIGSMFSSASASYAVHHGGGVVGTDSPFMTGIGNASLWTNSPRLHTGLLPDEYRAILKKDEGVFTPGQMKSLGAAINVATPEIKQPNVSVNVTNNTGTQADVSQKVHFNGQEIVVDMVLDALNRNVGGLRTAIGR